MKRASFVIFIIFILLHIEAQAQSYSFLTGIVAQFHGRGLTVKSDEGGVVQLRVGRRTVYSNRIPAVGDRVKVKYSIVRGVYVGYSVTILENTKKEREPQKKVIEKHPQLPSNLPPEMSGFVGKWEGFWDNIKDYRFTLTITNFNLELEVAEVKYESKDLQFSQKANVILGEKPRVEWVINSIVNPEGPFASPVTVGSKDYFTILSESIPIYYTFEVQKDGTLKGTFDSQRAHTLGTSRMAVMRRLD
ncbi:MAG TPA: hypothetical protein DCY12_12065 [Candidatus Atribacteria bacterium]|nr:hypothetical protein [Candidatus Atribacteria bacterium]